MDIRKSTLIPRTPKILASLAALLLFVIPARGDDTSAWWKGYVADAKPVTLPDGKKLTLFCEGKGTPVVMMEAGLGGGGITDWRKVQTAIGRVTKTCAYDRAGYWKSAPTNGPRDAGVEADDLAALLKAAKLPAPYVIVGHSYGGYITRLYAGRHTQDVGGLLLIDPSSAHQADRFAKALTSTKPREPQPYLFKDCSVDPRPSEFVSKCLRTVPADAPPELADMYIHSQTPAYASAMDREFTAMPALSSDLLDREKRSLGAMPFVLLSRDPTRQNPAYDAEENNAREQLWLQMHVEMMDLSSDSQLQVVPHAGHLIQFDRPDAVIAAITDMVRKVRGKH